MRAVLIEERGGWWSASAVPHPALRPYLDRYEGYWQFAGASASIRTIPTRHTVVIVNLGPAMRLSTPGTTDQLLHSFVAGMHDGPGRYVHPGGIRGVQLDLTPLGSYRLFGVSMRELTNIAVPLESLFGPLVRGFVERLAETPDWGGRFDLLDELLLRRLDLGPSPAPEVSRAWELLAASGGGVPVRTLTDEVGWSRKHLVDRFREQVGLSPKVMGRVLRFHRALDMLRQGVPGRADVALACGYYDQAHLNREFRTLAGCTPTELLSGS
jgi:AraC-like DNA-binding protein